MRGKKVDEWRDSVQAKGVIGKVDSVKDGQGKESVDEVGQRGRDLREKTGCEDICEVGDLNIMVLVMKGCCLVRRMNLFTLRVFLVSSTFASASLASMPKVLPRNLTSSTWSLSLSAWICGSMSWAVVSLRPLPSREKTFDPAILFGVSSCPSMRVCL